MSTINLSRAAAALTLGLTMAVPTMLPATASAAPQSHRQTNKNTWRNLGYAGGAVGVAGLLTHNKTLAIGGLAGGAYSAYRYEKDRKGQKRAQAHYRHHHHVYRHHAPVHHHY